MTTGKHNGTRSGTDYLVARDGSYLPRYFATFLVEADKRAFLVAKMIDDIFAAIHSRAVVTGAAVPRPAWLEQAELAYHQFGCFHEAEGVRQQA